MPRIKLLLDLAAYATFIVVILALPAFMDAFWLNRFAKCLVYLMLGLAIALSWGYAGVLNLGQGLFFGAGAYMLAMSLKLLSPTSLQQGSDTPVPDFMLWNAETNAPVDLCCINAGSFLWMPFQSQWFGVFMGIAQPVVVAFVVGTIMFRKRISGVFVSIITLALVLLVRLVVIDAQPWSRSMGQRRIIARVWRTSWTPFASRLSDREHDRRASRSAARRYRLPQRRLRLQPGARGDGAGAGRCGSPPRAR